jgi:uncharacterized Tic20 family protein
MPPEPNQGGYQPPPSGYQPPQGGYPVGPGMPPPGYANSEEKTWALISHFAGVLGYIGFVGALVAFLVKGNESPTVRAHSLAALNFRIVVDGSLFALLFLRICGGFFLPGFILLLFSLLAFVVWLGGAIFAVMAGMKANEGQLYRYPINLNLVK